ncbi:hypothetical protein ABE957_08765 [Halomonas sp. CS7]|uniref:Uncharacterized protein n=1 Tax=Halomonas pelophila TaxID=3151122 RepID=A0ABV1N4U9_9GAMM
MNPFANRANCSFSFSEEKSYRVKELRDAVMLMKLLTTSDGDLFIEFVLDGESSGSFRIGKNNKVFESEDDLITLECCLRLVDYFSISDSAMITPKNVVEQEGYVRTIDRIVNGDKSGLGVSFESLEGFSGSEKPDAPVACVFFVTSPLGNYIVGIFVVAVGEIEPEEGGGYKLVVDDVFLERKIAVGNGVEIKKEDVEEERDRVIEKYESSYFVINAVS